MDGVKSRRQRARGFAQRVAKASIGEERLREDAHFDIATIGGGGARELRNNGPTARGILARVGDKRRCDVASCVPALLKHCSPKLAVDLEKETWSFETAGSSRALGLAAINANAIWNSH